MWIIYWNPHWTRSRSLIHIESMSWQYAKNVYFPNTIGTKTCNPIYFHSSSVKNLIITEMFLPLELSRKIIWNCNSYISISRWQLLQEEKEILTKFYFFRFHSWNCDNSICSSHGWVFQLPIKSQDKDIKVRKNGGRGHMNYICSFTIWPNLLQCIFVRLHLA